MNKLPTLIRTMLLAAALCFSAAAHAADQEAAEDRDTLGKQLAVGDVVFIRIPHAPFTNVADATLSWTNHVGIVIDTSGAEPVIAESRVPLSGKTSWSSFVARSDQGRVAVSRLEHELDAQQREQVQKAATSRFGIHYDTGFDLHSRGQFCSRYVREVLNDATGEQLGKVENFSELLAHNPKTDLTFWRTWYFGYIPWQRETVTPASLLNDNRLHAVFDGKVSNFH